ncbi:MAG: YraN family protein [Candidatus Tantalella remota]|nr:YraN family protein [Candidatus Tantalella remota]
MDWTRRYIGKLGEAMAEKFLSSRGYITRDTNFTTPFGEIDLVADHEGSVVFVEIKTRISERFGPPLSAITRVKREHIIKNCQFYIKKNSLEGMPLRVDVIGINLSEKGKFQILKHVKNALVM